MAVRNYRTGFAVTDTPGDGVCLQASASASNYQTLLQHGSNYQVPAGKTLYITRVHFNVSVAGAAFNIGDATAAVTNSASSPANNIQTTGSITGTTTEMIIDCFIPVAQNLFPFLKAGSGSTNITCYGVVI